MSIKKSKVPDERDFQGREWLHARAAAKRYELPLSVLVRWALEVPCAWIGRKIAHQWHRPPGYGRRYLYLLRKDLDGIAAAMKAGEGPETQMVTVQRAANKLGRSAEVIQTLMRHHFECLQNRLPRSCKELCLENGVPRVRRVVHFG